MSDKNSPMLSTNMMPLAVSLLDYQKKEMKLESNSGLLFISSKISKVVWPNLEKAQEKLKLLIWKKNLENCLKKSFRA